MAARNTLANKKARREIREANKAKLDEQAAQRQALIQGILDEALAAREAELEEVS